LELEKFQADLAQLSEKDIALLRAIATAEEHEFTSAPFARKFQYEYFRRLTERGLLIRAGPDGVKLETVESEAFNGSANLRTLQPRLFS